MREKMTNDHTAPLCPNCKNEMAIREQITDEFLVLICTKCLYMSHFDTCEFEFVPNTQTEFP